MNESQLTFSLGVSFVRGDLEDIPNLSGSHVALSPLLQLVHLLHL